MKLQKLYILSFLLLVTTAMVSQNVGVGTNAPTEKLEVNGKVKANGLIVNTGGSQYDFLMKNTVSGEVGFRKAHGGLGLNYIICIDGEVPAPSGDPLTTPFLGEIKLFAGTFAPAGWAFCVGQILSVSQFPSLFSILGYTYGGNGQNTFALPDLRGTTAIGVGTAMPAGYQWVIGEKIN